MKKITAYLIILFVGMISIKTFAQVNSDKSTISGHMLPDLLISKNGGKIQSSNDWINIRRPEILELFRNYVYGKVPKHEVQIDFKVSKTISDALCGKAKQKEVIVSFSNGKDSVKMNILIFLPANSTKPVPLFLGMNFYGNHTVHTDNNITITNNWVRNMPELCIFNNKATYESRGVSAKNWPIERILERGFGIATVYYGDLDPDFNDEFQNGIHPLFYDENQKKPRQDEWGAISAWAYGLSKAMDYLETDKDINHEQIALIGHSRLGKTALWAGAQDERFSIVISNNSGCGGAALSRGKTGETVKLINTSFPHWFCGNFKEFNDNENSLPVDQHMLIALIAPRPVYIASAVEDTWADPKAEYLSLYYAGPVYNLFGMKSLKSDTLPELNKPIMIGQLGYHIRSGIHDLTRYDWERYMDFADLHFKLKDK